MLNSVPLSTSADSSKARGKRHLAQIYSLLLFALLVSLFLFMQEAMQGELWSLSVVATIITIGVLVPVIHASPIGVWSASAIYLVVFSLFHFGLTFVYSLGLPFDPKSEVIINRWFYSEYTVKAIVLCLLGLISCALGVMLAFCGRQARVRNSPLNRAEALDRALLVVGLCVLYISVLSWFFSVISLGGVQILVGSYAALRESTAGSLAFVYYGIGLGMALLGAAKPSRARKMGFYFFGFWALCAFPLGLRGEVLVPALAACALESRRKILLSTKGLAVAVVVLLALVTIVQQVRQVGLSGVGGTELRVNPLDAIAEMGGTLWPVAETLRWQETGDPYFYGGTYWAPIERALQLFIPFGERVNAMEDERLSNIVVLNRQRTFGYSPIAEAQRNFDAWGICMVMLITGFLLGRMDLWPLTPVRQIILGVIYVPLLIQVRNAFTPVPAQIVGGFVVLGIILLLSKWMQRGTRKMKSDPQGQTPYRFVSPS